MAKKYVQTLLLIFSFFDIFSQCNISGKIFDFEKKPIISASVILKDSSNKFISYSYSNQSGEFELKNIKIGHYYLSVSSIGFEYKKIEIELLEKKTAIELILKPSFTELKEVIIKSSSSMKIKSDTIVFNADFYKQGDEKVIEDLLRKIPGLVVDNNGTIRVGGKEVEKVMIEGDDFFEKGYKILTKNMPVSPIQNIEIYQHFSNNKLLKGIENSNKVAINLTLNDKAKNKWFGDMELSGGKFKNEMLYEFRDNLMKFSKKFKFYQLSNGNNIGDKAIEDLNKIFQSEDNNNISNLDDNFDDGELIKGVFETPNLKIQRFNFNKSKLFSINSILNISENLKFKILGFLDSDNNVFLKNNIDQFNIGNLNFINSEDFKGIKNKIGGLAKIDFAFDISSVKSLKYSGKFNLGNEYDKIELLFNQKMLNQNLFFEKKSNDQKFEYTEKINQNNVLVFSGRYFKKNTPQYFTTNQVLNFDLLPKNANNTLQFSEGEFQLIGLEGYLLNKSINGNLLEVKFGNQIQSNILKTQLELFENQVSLSVPNGFQNDRIYNLNDLYFSSKYNFNLNNLKIYLQSDFHQQFNLLKVANENLSEKPFFVVPNIGIDWLINKKNIFTASYSIKKQNISQNNLFQGYLQTDIRSLLKGIWRFNLNTTSNLFLNYKYGNFGDDILINTLFFYIKNHEYVGNNYSINQNYSVIQKGLLNNKDLINISSNFDYYLDFINSNFKLNLGLSNSKYNYQINNSSLLEINSLNTNFDIELRSGFKGVFNYHMGTKWVFSEMTNTIVHKNSYNISFLDFNFNIDSKLKLQIQTEKYFYNNVNSELYFIDFSGNYILKDNKLTLSLIGNNLLNNDSFKYVYISDQYNSEIDYKIRPINLLFKIEYRF